MTMFGGALLLLARGALAVSTTAVFRSRCAVRQRGCVRHMSGFEVFGHVGHQRSLRCWILNCRTVTVSTMRNRTSEMAEE